MLEPPALCGEGSTLCVRGEKKKKLKVKAWWNIPPTNTHGTSRKKKDSVLTET